MLAGIAVRQGSRSDDKDRRCVDGKVNMGMALTVWVSFVWVWAVRVGNRAYSHVLMSGMRPLAFKATRLYDTS